MKCSCAFVDPEHLGRAAGPACRRCCRCAAGCRGRWASPAAARRAQQAEQDNAINRAARISSIAIIERAGVMTNVSHRRAVDPRAALLSASHRPTQSRRCRAARTESWPSLLNTMSSTPSLFRSDQARRRAVEDLSDAGRAPRWRPRSVPSPLLRKKRLRPRRQPTTRSSLPSLSKSPQAARGGVADRLAPGRPPGAVTSVNLPLPSFGTACSRRSAARTGRAGRRRRSRRRPGRPCRA